VLDSLTPGCEWIPAGTDAGNKTSAGRIGGILAAATDRQRAVQEAYAQTEKITFISTEKSRPHYRTDITFPDMKSEQERR
jgi:phosphoribosylamine-glycine ligase